MNSPERLPSETHKPITGYLWGALAVLTCPCHLPILAIVLAGTTAGALIERFGYVDFYLLTTGLAVPGILLFWLMMRAGLIDASVGTAATAGKDQPAA